MHASIVRVALGIVAGLSLAVMMGCQSATTPTSNGSSAGDGGTSVTPVDTAQAVGLWPTIQTDTLTTKPQAGETLALTLKGPQAATITWLMDSSDPYAVPEASTYNTEKKTTLLEGTYTYKLTLTTAAGVVRESAAGELAVKVGMWKFEIRLGPSPLPTFDSAGGSWSLSTSLATKQVQFAWWRNDSNALQFGSDNATDAESLKYSLKYDVYDASGAKKTGVALAVFTEAVPESIRDSGGVWKLSAGSGAGYTWDEGYRIEFTLDVIDGDNNYTTFTKSVTMAKDTSAPVETLAGSWFWEPKYALGVDDGVTDWIGFPLPTDNFQSADQLTYMLMLYDATATAPTYAKVLTDSMASSISARLKSVVRKNGSTAWVAEVSTNGLPASTTRWAYLVAQDLDGNRSVVGKCPVAVSFTSGHHGQLAY